MDLRSDAPAATADANVFRSRVGRRTLLLFLVCAILPVSALAAVSFHQVTAQLQRQTERTLRQASKAEGMAVYERLLFLDAALRVASSRAGAGWSPLDGLDPPLKDRFRVVIHEDLPALTEAQRRHLGAGRSLLETTPTANGPARISLRLAVAPARLQAGTLVGEIEPAYLFGAGTEHMLPHGMELCVLTDSGAVLFCSVDARPGARDQLAARWPLFLKAEFLGPAWTVVLSQPRTEALAPLAKFSRTFVLVVLLSLGTVLLLSIGQIRHSLLPLQKLQHGARRIAARDFGTRVEVASRDEFADVAASFNTMSDRLSVQFAVLTALKELNSALNRGQRLDEILQRCAEALQRHLGFAVVEIWELGAGQHVLERRASAGPEAAGDATAMPVTDRGLGLIVRDGQPRVVVESLDDPSVPDPAWARRAGMATFVGQPLVTAGKVVGIIAAFARQPVDEVVLGGLGSAAGDVAGAIERARVAEALRESGEQVRQLQKMEAVGRLAGGIAHDFNNLLTVIGGYTQILLRTMRADDPMRSRLGIIDDTAGRAASLTRQLLAFSRKRVLAPSVLDLNGTVSASAQILKRLIGEQIDLEFRPGADLGRVEADPGQLEQVIMNLVVNARDAMPDGGRITLTTSEVEVPEDQCSRLGVSPGAYVMLSVTDTGVGMDAQTQARIFEPFFTTKAVGKGTGLGLATVYGIVSQSHGGFRVESAPGQGTTFEVYLPRVAGEQAPSSGDDGPVPEGTETILLVEDEASVLGLVEEILTGLGYAVLATDKVEDACLAAERHPGPIHLLLTDVVMPQMSGFALAGHIVARHPRIKVLYMSGYSDHPAVGRDIADVDTPCIQKPFTRQVLARKVRERLDR